MNWMSFGWGVAMTLLAEIVIATGCFMWTLLSWNKDGGGGM